MVLANAAWLNHAYLGETEVAETQSSESLAFYREIGEARGEAQCLSNLGSVAARRGDLGEARQFFSEAIGITREVEDSWLTAQILRHLASLELDIGEPGLAIALLEESIDLCEDAGMEDLVVVVRAFYGSALLACGREAEADAATTTASAALRPGIDQAYLVSHARAEVLRSLGDHDGADRHLENAHHLLMEMLGDLDDEDRERAVARVPAHARIVEDWLRRRPLIERVSVASTGAPGGRTLDEADHVQVEWTISTPADERIEDRIERRRIRLLRLIHEAAEQGGSPTVEDLAEALESSSATIRRDLAALRSEGRRVETRGSRHPDTA